MVNKILFKEKENSRYCIRILNTIIEFMDITHRPVYYLKHNVSETGFCLLPQVKAYSAGPNRQSYSLSPDLRMKTESSLRNFVLNKK
jgi:hypothetical protein